MRIVLGDFEQTIAVMGGLPGADINAVMGQVYRSEYRPDIIPAPDNFGHQDGFTVRFVRRPLADGYILTAPYVAWGYNGHLDESLEVPPGSITLPLLRPQMDYRLLVLRSAWFSDLAAIRERHTNWPQVPLRADTVRQQGVRLAGEITAACLQRVTQLILQPESPELAPASSGPVS